jgi:hypothetical protein
MLRGLALCDHIKKFTIHTSAGTVAYVVIDAVGTVAPILTWRILLWSHCTLINIFLTVLSPVAWRAVT